MALKDWKNIGRKGFDTYSNKKGDVWIKVSKTKKGFTVAKLKMGNLTILGNFKTKSEALKYAKAYMKKH